VYGISTPGPKATSTDQIASNPQAVIYRKGGHQFIMDDGDKNGTDQLVRLRTSSGHQILMNDTENVLYIASSSGMQWLEFSPDGSINIFGAAGINMRSQGPLNLHSDAMISMCAPAIDINAIPTGGKGAPSNAISLNSAGSVSINAISTASLKADMTVTVSSVGKTSVIGGMMCTVSSVGDLKLAAGGLGSLSALGELSIDGTMLLLNSGKPSKPSPPVPGVPKIGSSLPDADFGSAGWAASTTLRSTCKVVPTHEPWTRPTPPSAN
jgi:hypothetical protein